MVHPPDDRASIYRAQALQYRKNAWLGTARLSRQANGVLPAVTSVVTLLALACTLAFGRYSERVAASGTVVFDPPAIVVSPPAEGVVVTSFSAEGQFVKQGDPLFAVSTATAMARGSYTRENKKLLERRRAELLAHLNQIREDMAGSRALLKEKLSANQRTRQRLRALATRASSHADWMRTKLAKYEKLRRDGTALEPEVIDRMKDLFIAYESVAAAELKALEAEREQLEVHAQRLLAEKEEKVRLDALSSQIFALDQRILDMDKAEAFLVLAPAEGMLASVTVREGGQVGKDRSLAVIIPPNAVPKIEVFTPSHAIGRIKDGNPAKVRVAAFPYAQYGKIDGTVESFSATPVNLRASANLANDKPLLFRITLAIDPAQERLERMTLSAGMDVSVDIFLRTARLYEWVFKTTGNLLS